MSEVRVLELTGGCRVYFIARPKEPNEIGFIVPKSHSLARLPHHVLERLELFRDTLFKVTYRSGIVERLRTPMADEEPEELDKYVFETQFHREHFGLTDDDLLFGNRWKVIDGVWPLAVHDGDRLSKMTVADVIRQGNETVDKLVDGDLFEFNVRGWVQWLQEVLDAKDSEISTLQERILRLKRS